MPASLEGQLVVAISSRALFDFEEENRLFEAGDDQAYMRLQLQRLEHGGTFFRTDASGERHYYSDAEVEAARRELRDRTREMCD